MMEMTCPSLPGDWVNAWLAAVGATVLDDRISLRWTTDGSPVAVLSSETVDPVAALVESWPDTEFLCDLPIAEDWRGEGNLRRRVPVDAFQRRARAARGHRHSWTLSSTMTDLCVNREGDVEHARFDPPVPKGIFLHDRLVRVHCQVEPSISQLRNSLAGLADRVQGNGLGFDLGRLGSLSDKSDPWVDPVVEVLAFFGLALLPVRGVGTDIRMDRRADITVRQRGWRQREEGEAQGSFCWPAWSPSLGSDGIDALLDCWNPERKDRWPQVGVHAAWRTVAFQRTGTSDTTRAFGSARL